MIWNFIPLLVMAIVAVIAARWQGWMIANFDYQCGYCGRVFSLPLWQAMIAPHRMGQKLVRCPYCGHVTWTTPVRK